MGLLMGLFGAVRYATRTSGEAEGHQDFQPFVEPALCGSMRRNHEQKSAFRSDYMGG